MLCKNCNYILTGKENFCPNCASPLREKNTSVEQKEKKAEEKKIKEEKYDTEIISRELIFPEGEVKKPTEKKSVPIFLEPEEKNEKEYKEKNRSYAGKIMLLIFLTCVFTAGAFTVADYFGITASVANYINQNEPSTTQAVYNHGESIIAPDFSYVPQTAYVMSGKGLYLRKGPGNGYAYVVQLEELTPVTVCGGSLAQQQWVYVYCTEKESYGWLDSGFLGSDEVEDTTTATRETSAVIVTVESLDGHHDYAD